MNLITIYKHKKTSYHTSFKKACAAYGWDYRRLTRNGIPDRHDGHIIKKVATGVTIYDQQIIELIVNGFDQDDSWHRDHDHESAEAKIMINEGDFVVNVRFDIENRSEVGTIDEYGEKEILNSTEYTNLEILDILDYEGEDISASVNSGVKQLLIEKLEITY